MGEARREKLKSARQQRVKFTQRWLDDFKVLVRHDAAVVAPRTPTLMVRSPRLRAAYESLDLTQRGSREELDERDRQELAAWATARRRAVH